MKIKIFITDDKSNDESLSQINKILNITNIETKLININENEFKSLIAKDDKEITSNKKKINKNFEELLLDKIKKN